LNRPAGSEHCFLIRVIDQILQDWRHLEEIFANF
jgi:hypothetical protein